MNEKEKENLDKKNFRLPKTKYYMKVNNVRSHLLKIIDNSIQKKENNYLKINSKTTQDYYEEYVKNIIITLKKKNIISISKKKVSFLKDIEDNTYKSIDLIKKDFVFNCQHHYNIFKERKKIVISKQSYSNLLLNINKEKNDNSTPSSICSCSTDDKSFLLSNLIKQEENSKIYFDYLHTLFFSLHKNYYKGEIIRQITLNHISPKKVFYNNNHHIHKINKIEKKNTFYGNQKRFSKAISINLLSVNHLSDTFLPKRKYV